MFSALGQTWRSIASVVIAYVITIILFVVAPDSLYGMLNFADGIRAGLNGSIGSNLGPQAGILFQSFISAQAVFMTIMFLFARVVVLAFALWLFSMIVGGMFGGSRS